MCELCLHSKVFIGASSEKKWQMAFPCAMTKVCQVISYESQSKITGEFCGDKLSARVCSRSAQPGALQRVGSVSCDISV